MSAAPNSPRLVRAPLPRHSPRWPATHRGDSPRRGGHSPRHSPCGGEWTGLPPAAAGTVPAFRRLLALAAPRWSVRPAPGGAQGVAQEGAKGGALALGGLSRFPWSGPGFGVVSGQTSSSAALPAPGGGDVWWGGGGGGCPRNGGRCAWPGAWWGLRRPPAAPRGRGGQSLWRPSGRRSGSHGPVGVAAPSVGCTGCQLGPATRIRSGRGTRSLLFAPTLP